MVNMVKITIEITELEWKGLAYVAVSPEEWITNFTQVRARAALQEIYDNEIQRMLADPEIKTMPADRDEVIRNAEIESAAERQLKFLANPIIPPDEPDPAPAPN
jgi:hypothetical protein